MTARSQPPLLSRLLGAVLIVALCPLWISLILLVLLSQLIYAAFIYCLVWFWCIPRGKYFLFVSSQSPNWHDYMQSQILPLVTEHAFVLDYSERETWRNWSLPVLLFRFFGGVHNFNPMVVRFYRFGLAHTIRFRRGFIEAKHGKPEELESLRVELVSVVKESL